MHPGSWKKASRPVVRCWHEVKSCTPASRKKQVAQWCKEMPPRLCLVGRTPPSIKLLTSVNKAGDCWHEVKSCTPEAGKKQVAQWCKEMPPRLCLVGRTPPSIKLLTSVNKAGDCRHEVKSCTPESSKKQAIQRCKESVLCPVCSHQNRR